MSVEKETSRIEGFSDGVFAIAITLLVLDLHVPEDPAAERADVLLRLLLDQWPSYLAFIFSFLSILILWVNHHKLFKQIYRRNTAITFANGLLLFFVSAVSYPTALLSRYLNTGAESLVVSLYTGLFVLINLSYLLIWHSASRDKSLLRPDIKEPTIQKIKRNYWYGLPVYIVAFIFSFSIPLISLTLCGLLLVYWAFSSGRVHMD